MRLNLAAERSFAPELVEDDAGIAAPAGLREGPLADAWPAPSPYPETALSDVCSPTFGSFLDFSRWTAAAMVFVGHLRDPLFLGYGDVTAADRSLLVKVWYFATGWHAEAVVVFFVLSGFLVGGLASAKLRLGRFSVASYAIDRSTRIYLAFLPALLLTVVLDRIGTGWLAGAGLYDGTQAMIHQKVAAEVFTRFMSPETLAYNVAMLQTFCAPPYGSNPPLWSISAEFWFYVVFGIFAFAFLRRRSVLGRLALASAFGMAAVLGGQFGELMGLWLTGTLAAFVPRGRFERPVLAAVTLVLALVLIRAGDNVIRPNGNLIILKNHGVALLFGWLVVSMRRVSWQPLVRLAALNRHMADFSYSLYLLHFPLMIFLLSALYATGRFPQITAGYAPTSPVGLALYAGIIVADYASAWGFSQLTERQTGHVRHWLQARLRRA